MESINVKLKVLNASIVKRIGVPETYNQLKQLASSLVKNKPVLITYVDTDGDNVEVMDDSDLKLALKSSICSRKILFQVLPFADYDKPILMQA
jgi:hypothetical protein